MRRFQYPLLILIFFIMLFHLPSSILGQDRFSEKRYISPSLEGLSSICVGDVDGDNDDDLICVTVETGEIVWFQNISGEGDFLPPVIIFEDFNTELSQIDILCEDIDNDGDLDIIVTLDTVYWLENLDGEAHFSEPILAVNFDQYTDDIICTDIDLDSDLDIVCCSEYYGIIYYVLNQDGFGNFGPPIFIDSELSLVTDMVCNDFNNDTYPDILISSADTTNRLTWFENNPDNSSFIAHPIDSENIGSPITLNSGDINGDGNIDFVVASVNQDQLSVFINNDGQGSFEFHSVVALYENINDVSLADLDADSDIDILFSSEENNSVAWCENTDGEGTFNSPDILLETENWPLKTIASDIDGDDDKDIIIAGSFHSRSTLIWLEYRIDSFSIEHDLLQNTTANYDIYTSDINNDGFQDVVSSNIYLDEITMFQYDESHQVFNDRQTLTDRTENPYFLVSADINDDGFPDLVMYTDEYNKIVWSKNLAGTGDFDTPRIVGYLYGTLSALHCDDMNNDGTIDVVCATTDGDVIIWFENYNGLGQFYPPQQVDNIEGVKWLDTGDLDGDGDQDIIAATEESIGAVWYKNNGDGDFNDPVNELDSERASCCHLDIVDIDNDGDMDIVTTSQYNDGTVLFKNHDGEGAFSEPILIRSWSHCYYVYGTDIDVDGDIDLLLGRITEMRWLENTNGTGDSFVTRESFMPLNGIKRMRMTDIENDGDEDIVFLTNRGDICWSQNLSDGMNPYPFDLYLPENGASITTETVELLWEEASDPDDNIEFYNIYVSQDENQIYESPIDTSHSSRYVFIPDESGGYYWTIGVEDADGNHSYADQIFRFIYNTVEIEENQKMIPAGFAIDNIYPNPFNPETVITLAIPATTSTKVSIFNILGQEVAVLQDGVLKAGYRNFTFSGQGLAGGCYIVKASTVNGDIAMKKMVLLK